MGNFDDDWIRRTDRRLDSHDEKLTRIEQEQIRIRRRLHDLEADRHAMRLLAGIVRDLAKKASDALDTVDKIAETAVEKVLDHRRDEKRRDWKYRMALTSAGAAIATASIYVVSILAHL